MLYWILFYSNTRYYIGYYSKNLFDVSEVDVNKIIQRKYRCVK